MKFKKLKCNLNFAEVVKGYKTQNENKIEKIMEAAFVFIALFAGLFGIIYYYLLSRHRERMSLIENGADAKLFQAEPRKKPYFFAMLVGVSFICLSLGIGLGFLVDNWLREIGTLSRHGDFPGAYFFMIFLMLGIGFIVSYFLHKKLVLESKEESKHN